MLGKGQAWEPVGEAAPLPAGCPVGSCWELKFYCNAVSHP